MNVLVLGISPSPLSPILEEHGCRVVECFDAIDVKYVRDHAADFAVSYRYSHIIGKPVIDYLNGRVINLHISLLPWNRGAAPNFWSFLEDTPKGVTIHYIDEGLDTGDIIVQKEVFYNDSSETLATTYKKLNAEIIELFKLHWPSIAAGKVLRRRQPQGGSFHKVNDKKSFEHLLYEKGWDTPVSTLIGKALVRSEK